MLTSANFEKPTSSLLRFIAIALSILGFATPQLSVAQTNTTTPTTIAISDSPKLTTAKRLGLNLGNQDFYDSGIFMRNLTFRNPGFEGEIWQTIMHCQYVTANTCTDDNTYTYWPANFIKGASVEFTVGSLIGTTTTVQSSTAAVPGSVGTVVTFSTSVNPQVGDYLVVRMNVPGNAQAGWWTGGTAGTVYSTEFNDLSPNSPGKQALRITNGASDQSVLTSYMDSIGGRSFLQLKGNLTLTFRAKSVGGSNQLNIALGRLITTGGPNTSLFNQNVALTNGWQDYTYTFAANDNGAVGTLNLKFTMAGGSMLIDDVALTQPAASNNPTVYRNEVVSTLQALKPGILRFMDSGTNWGSSFDNLLAPDFARQRAGYSNLGTEMDDIPLNLHDYLVLCQTIGAEPWFTMEAGMSNQEMSNIMDYFGGSTSTVYGAKRAALGQTAAWTTVFPKIHLEFGNEVWNTSNPGATMSDATSYGKRTASIFATAKASASYSASKFDLVIDGWEAVTYWTTTALAASDNYDTVDAASYLFTDFNDASSTENIYGPMFAEPEAVVSNSAGIMAANAVNAATAARPAKLSVYETSLGTITGSVSQTTLNATIPSLGAGLTVADNMLLMMRDLGITDQNMFALPGFTVNFGPTGGSTAKTTPLWGTVIDMGGLTNLQRPMMLAETMANQAILPTLWSTTQLGANPTWNQAQTTNDNFSLTGAHYIQSFAFTDGVKENIILFNLSRTSALPVNFSGLNAPLGSASISTLTAPSIEATNETTEGVAVSTKTATLVAGATYTLPAYSMTVISVAAPVVPILVNSVTTTCPQSALSVNQTLTCTAAVAGQGKYSSAVTWSVDQGTISNTGVYSAPATLPASGKAIITATSVGDTTKKGSFSLTLAPDSITGVTASCNASTVGQGQVVNCSAVVKGTGGFSPAYTWTTTGGSIDAKGNLTAPALGTTVTVTATSTQDSTKSASVTLPVFAVILISNPKSSVTSTTATISWTLNSPAHSGISYGLTQSFGSTTPYDNALITNPSYTLTGLKPNTTYYMALFSYTAAQTVGASFSATTSSAGSTVTSISITCGSSSLLAGSSLTCVPKVLGTGSFSSAVNWSASAGSITPAGILTAPTTGSSVTVTATSSQDTTKSASQTLAVTQSSTITGVTVSCQSTSLLVASLTTCSSAVKGTGSFSSAVTWSASGGIITPLGVLTAPASGTAVTVTATSVQDPTKSGSANIALTSNASVTHVLVSCKSATLAGGSATTCTPTVLGTGKFSSAVNWSTSAISTSPTAATATSAGTVSSTGVFTAPTTAGTFKVRATSVEDPTISGVAIITVTSNSTITGVSVACGATGLVEGKSTTCTSAVTGTGAYSSAVTWSTSAGSITSAGVLTAPTTGTSVTVKATSVADPTKFATKVLTVSSTANITGVSVTCQALTLVPGATTPCAASVAGSGSYSSAVTWTISAGSITSGGVATAPAVGTTVTVRATSVANPAVYGVTGFTINYGLAISKPTFTVTSTTATIKWTLNIAAHNGISYNTGSGAYITTPYNNATTTTPSITLTGLKAGTTYNIGVFSFINGQTVGQSLTVTTPAAANTVGSVAVSCAGTTLSPLASTGCSATVQGTGSYSSAVVWSASAGSITNAGLLTAPATGSSLTVKAASVQDPTKYATVTIAIAEKLAILNPTFSATPTTIVLHWTVTQNAHNGVNYGTTLSYGQTTPYDNNSITNPTITLTGLTPGTTYYIADFSFNANGTVGTPLVITTPKQ